MVRYWHVADCPDDCNIESNDEYRSGPGVPPPLSADKTAMMLGLVPDIRTPAERCQFGDSEVGQCIGNVGHAGECVYENVVDERIRSRRAST